MTPHVPHPRQQIVGPETRRELEPPDRAALVDREDELLRLHEVRGEPPQASTLPTPLQHQPDVALLEVAESSVDQLRRPARGARGEVGVLDQRGPDPAHRRVARDTGAVDAASDHEEIERLAAESSERRAARGHARFYPAPDPMSRRVMESARTETAH